MKKDPLIFIEHIKESIENIELYSKDVSKDKFLKDKKIQDAVVRRLEVIGEAAKRIPKDFRDRYPRIPWRGMSGMRDKVIHEYFGVDAAVVWRTVREDLPPLRESIAQALSALKMEQNNS